jgi:hypothetical protein
MRSLRLPAACLFAVAISLTGCAGSDGTGASSPPAAADPATSAADPATSSAADAATESPSDTAAARAAGTAGDAPLTLNKSAASLAYGDSWTVEQVVRHFPVPERFAALKGREIVAVKVKIKSGTKFYTVFGADSFRLIGDDGQDNAATGVFEQELVKAGLSPVLKDARRGQGSEGWIAFTLVHPDSTSLTLRYRQLAAKVIGSTTTIPDKNIDLKLVG